MSNLTVQEQLSKCFTFCKQLPTHLISSGNNITTFVVSPGRANVVNLVAALRKTFNDPEVKIVAESKKKIKIKLGENDYCLLISDQPVWTYMINYSFLGTFIALVLQRCLSNDLVVNKEGLYLRHKAYTSSNHNVTINEELVTSDIAKVFSLLKLSMDDFMADIKTPLDFRSFLMSSPYMHELNLKSLQSCDHAQLSEFYIKYIYDVMSLDHSFELRKIHPIEGFKILGFNKEKFDFLCQEREAIGKAFYSKFNINNYLDLCSTIGLDKEDLGKMMGKYAASFKSKEGFKQYILQKSVDEIYTELKSYIIESRKVSL